MAMKEAQLVSHDNTHLFCTDTYMIAVLRVFATNSHLFISSASTLAQICTLLYFYLSTVGRSSGTANSYLPCHLN